MTGSEWISHNDARELVGRSIYRDDWIGSLTADEIELLNGQYGPKRYPRPPGSSGYFEVIAPCPTPALGRKIDAAIGRDRRMIVQLTTVLEWLDQSGFAALEKRYPRSHLQAAVAEIAPSTLHARPAGVGKRGPVKGAIARYAEDDRSLFPQIRRLIDQGFSPTAAAEQLADRLKGGGTLESKATRLRKLFMAEVS